MKSVIFNDYFNLYKYPWSNQRDYEAILKQLNEDFDLTVKTVTCDFESAVWSATRDAIPGTKMLGCLFHFNQALFRKIQSLGLATSYDNNEDFKMHVKKMMALPFLPSEWIENIFNQLCSQQPAASLQQFHSYIKDTWIDGQFPPESWSVYKRTYRTNNDVEGYHNRLNRNARQPNLNLYTLIDVLHKESLQVDYDVRFLVQGKIGREERHHKVFDLWDQLASGDITAKQLLQEVVKFNGPKPRYIEVPEEDDQD